MPRGLTPATREALRYRAALRRGFESIQRRPLCPATAVQVCRVIQDQALDIRRVPGTRLANPANGQVVYAPSEGEGLIRDKLGASSIDPEKATQFFRVRLWNQDDLIGHALAHYDHLDERLRAELPLQRIWVVARS